MQDESREVCLVAKWEWRDPPPTGTVVGKVSTPVTPCPPIRRVPVSLCYPVSVLNFGPFVRGSTQELVPTDLKDLHVCLRVLFLDLPL